MREIWKVLALVIAAFVAMATDVGAEEFSVATAINKAGRQRMLTQRIVKAYAQLGMEVTPDLSQLQLRQAVETFDQQLLELRAFAPNAAIRASVTRMAELWEPFRQAATAPASRESVARLLAMEGTLLAAANTLTQQLQDYAGLPVGRLVNTAGRQRMLSQQLAKLYMLRAWGITSPQLSGDTETAAAEFIRALAYLQAAPENTYALNRELDAVAVQWTWFRTALEQEGEYRSFLLVVADASETMLLSLDHITDLYEQLARR